MKRPRLKRVPSGVVELLRLFVVVFFAGLGSLVGSQWNLDETPFAGVDGALLGVVLGSFLGYALGGVLGRSTVAAVDRTEERHSGIRQYDGQRDLQNATVGDFSHPNGQASGNAPFLARKAATGCPARLRHARWHNAAPTG